MCMVCRSDSFNLEVRRGSFIQLLVLGFVFGHRSFTEPVLSGTEGFFFKPRGLVLACYKTAAFNRIQIYLQLFWVTLNEYFNLGISVPRKKGS